MQERAQVSTRAVEPTAELTPVQKKQTISPRTYVASLAAWRMLLVRCCRRPVVIFKSSCYHRHSFRKSQLFYAPSRTRERWTLSLCGSSRRLLSLAITFGLSTITLAFSASGIQEPIFRFVWQALICPQPAVACRWRRRRWDSVALVSPHASLPQIFPTPPSTLVLCCYLHSSFPHCRDAQCPCCPRHRPSRSLANSHRQKENTLQYLQHETREFTRRLVDPFDGVSPTPTDPCDHARRPCLGRRTTRQNDVSLVVLLCPGRSCRRWRVARNFCAPGSMLRDMVETVSPVSFERCFLPSRQKKKGQQPSLPYTWNHAGNRSPLPPGPCF